MLTLIRNAQLYAPEALGLGHLVLGGGKILWLGADLPPVAESLVFDEFDAQGAALTPGFIDGHVHVTGGGGEDGFSTQAPVVPLSQFTRNGVTSVVGLLGTDDETRTTAGLLARTRALREEGLSAWCWTGGYHVPPTTLTGSVRSDIVNIDCIIGLGELAISDHRSSQPTFDELARLASEAHVAGLIARKAGVVHFHLGDGERGLELLRRLLSETELPPRAFHPTHVNRRKALFEEACELAKQGVTIDVTAFPVEPGEDAWSAADAWEKFHQADCAPQHLTVSSDGGGCLPVFDSNGRMVKMDFASSAGLPETVQELLQRGHGLETILPCVTCNVADALRLQDKGRLKTGADADLLILDDSGGVRQVMANGRWMVKDGEAIRPGTFE